MLHIPLAAGISPNASLIAIEDFLSPAATPTIHVLSAGFAAAAAKPALNTKHLRTAYGSEKSGAEHEELLARLKRH